jgi:hypothetical protein
MYTSNLPLISALDGGGWSTPRPGRFTHRKEIRYPFYRRLGRPQGRSGRLWKISPLPGFGPRTVQPVATRYTDCSIPALPSGCIFLHRPSTNYYRDVLFNPLQAGNTRLPSLGETVRPRDGERCIDRATDDAM